MLMARTSADGGDTWSDPVVIDEVSPDDDIVWVSFVQPADGYPDNKARFFFGHTRREYSYTGRRFRQKLRWTGFGVRLRGDVDGDGVIGFRDLELIMRYWGPCKDACPADFTHDGFVGREDLSVVLANWTRG